MGWCKLIDVLTQDAREVTYLSVFYFVYHHLNASPTRNTKNRCMEELLLAVDKAYPAELPHLDFHAGL
jgi:hypothetical protein